MSPANMQRAATRLGIPYDDYRAQVAAGNKWCSACQTWHPLSAFGRRWDRGDGRNYVCLESDRVRARESMRRLYARRKGLAS